MSKSGWIAVDLDGTLAEYPGTFGIPHGIGKPIPKMVDRVKTWLAEGLDVRIMTARAAPPYINEKFQEVSFEDSVKEIKDWCEEHIGVRLPVTCQKDYSMIELWDDRAVQVFPNTGESVKEAYDRLRISSHHYVADLKNVVDAVGRING